MPKNAHGRGRLTTAEGPKVFLRGIRNIYRRYRTFSCEKRIVEWKSDQPVISFTFDDFPRSAYEVGGAILNKYHVCGSFYASFGLCEAHTSRGKMFSIEDLKEILHSGHEIGCHTYDHLDAWETPADIFEESIKKNITAFMSLFSGYTMRTFAYPRSNPHPKVKAVAARYFKASRGGGQKINNKILDLNLIRSCFIDYKNRNNLDFLKELIEKNAKDKRWLVFSTHDVGEIVSPHGCYKDAFEEIVARSVESGALVLPVHEVCQRLVI